MQDAAPVFNQDVRRTQPWSSWNPKTKSFTLEQDGVPTQVTLTEYVNPTVELSLLRDDMARRADFQADSIRKLWEEVREFREHTKKAAKLRELDESYAKERDSQNKDALKSLTKKHNLHQMDLEGIKTNAKVLRMEVKANETEAGIKIASLSVAHESLYKQVAKQKLRIRALKETVRELAQALQETRDALDFLPGNLTFLEAKQHFSELLKDGAYVCEQTMGGWEKGEADGELHTDRNRETGDKPGPADEGTEEQEREEGSGEGAEEAPVHPDQRDEEEDDVNSGSSSSEEETSSDEEEDGYYCLTCQTMHSYNSEK